MGNEGEREPLSERVTGRKIERGVGKEGETACQVKFQDRANTVQDSNS